MKKAIHLKSLCLLGLALLAGSIVTTSCSSDNGEEEGMSMKPDIALNKETLVLEVGSTERLVASFTPAEAPNKGHTWTSSAAAVASVDETGLVTAVAEGNAVITATALDGGKMASCAVQVVDRIVHVTQVRLDKTDELLTVGSKLQLTATVTPAAATDKSLTWTSSNADVATVDANGLVTGVSEGTVVITAITNDGTKEATCQLTVSSSETDEPDTPVDITTHFYPVNVYDSQLYLKSEAPAGVTKVDICYGLKPNPTITDNVTTAEVGSDGLLLLHLENLLPGSAYYIRAYTLTSNGIEYYEDEVSVQTVGRTSGDFQVNYTRDRFEQYTVQDVITLHRYRIYWTIDYNIKLEGTYRVSNLLSSGAVSKTSTYNGDDFYITNGSGRLYYKRENGSERYEGRTTYIDFPGTDYIRFESLETGITYYCTMPSSVEKPIF